MPYPESLVSPMRAELTRLGVRELRDASEVENTFKEWGDEEFVLVVNSVCGCAAANARPAVALAMQAEGRPEHWATVFAGQDLDATSKAREFLAGIPPSSPFIAVMKGGEPVFVLERKHIEGRSASMIASDLVGAFNGAAPGAPVAPASSDSFRSIL